MAFPYSIVSTIKLEAPEYHLEQLPLNIPEVLRKSLINKGFTVENGSYIGRNSLFGIAYKFSFKLNITEDNLIIKTRIVFQDFVNLLLIINLLVAFGFKFRFEEFLWFVFLVDLGLYLLNFLIVKNSLNHTMRKLFDEYRKSENI